MINNIFGFDFNLILSVFQDFMFSAFLGIVIRQAFSTILNQEWVRTFSQIVLFSILPVTGYLITSIISNNIALSLGMVGALSIVRFRTPVKNPFELVSYFILITVGIVVNVDKNIAFNFVIFSLFAFSGIQLALFFMQKYFPNYADSDSSFKFFLTIETSEELQNLNYKEFLHFSNKNKVYLYRFGSNDQDRIESIRKQFNSKKIISSSIDVA